MSFQSKIFNSVCRELGDGNHLHFINIPTLNGKISTHIDNSIVLICEGATGSDLATIKQRLISYLTPKKGTTIEMGAIAEFFGHLYLTELGFNQEFLFLNLEEGSIKKGFDGYYTFDNETWIFESKSGSPTTSGATHDSRVIVAYKDLKEKISGNPANNPWQNAYNHACHIDVSSEVSIRKNLKALAEAFTQGKRQEMDSFNIIPGSTLFLQGAWSDINENDLSPKLEKLVRTFRFNKIHIICINKASIDQFWAYLET